jgi:ATP-dependent exoDNAse (exonuclease V) alpha subunit
VRNGIIRSRYPRRGAGNSSLAGYTLRRGPEGHDKTARGHCIAVGNLIISRRNDPSVTIYEATQNVPAADPVRNGNRWRVIAVDTEHNRIAARRLEDGARAAFSGDYLRQHITHGYAVTVHSAQGATADTTHAVLGENTTRAMLYVAMTRGRESNSEYL